jgi:hypothetical protein
LCSVCNYPNRRTRVQILASALKSICNLIIVTELVSSAKRNWWLKRENYFKNRNINAVLRLEPFTISSVPSTLPLHHLYFLIIKKNLNYKT